MDPNTRTDVVFDTDCVLCSGAVHFVLTHERSPSTRFVSAWSETGLAIAAAHGLTRDDLRTTYLVVEDGRGFTKSDAVRVLARHLRRPWSWTAPLLGLLPRPIRDRAYLLVARNRYRWFGHKQSCFIPPAEARDRFVSA